MSLLILLLSLSLSLLYLQFFSSVDCCCSRRRRLRLRWFLGEQSPNRQPSRLSARPACGMSAALFLGFWIVRRNKRTRQMRIPTFSTTVTMMSRRRTRSCPMPLTRIAVLLALLTIVVTLTTTTTAVVSANEDNNVASSSKESSS